MKTNKISGILAVLMLLLASIPSAVASEGLKTVDVEKLNAELDKSLEKYFGGNFPYDPEVVSVEKIDTVDQDEHISKYLMTIRVAEGDYGIRSVTIYMRDDLAKEDLKGLSCIFAGQSLSGKGGYYEYFAIEGAKNDFVVAATDRGEVEIPTDADANAILEGQGVNPTLADYFVEIAASHLLVSDMFGIPAEKIDTSVTGHSLGAFFLALYGSSDYQDIPLGHIDDAVFVDVIINYDSEYEELRLGQVENAAKFEEKYNAGGYAASGMKDSIFIAQQVVDGVLGAHELFDLAVSQTYNMKKAMGENSYTPDYHYWSADCDTELIAQKVVDGAAVPYSALESDWYMTKVMSGETPIGNLRGLGSILYVGFDGGFGFYGEDWFFNQGAEIYHAGSSGHAWMFDQDTESSCDYIWDHLEDAQE